VDELESSTAKIAVTCWASEVQVTGSRRYAALVRLDITRRDPLRMVVASPLAQVPPGPDQLAIGAGPLPVLALDLAGVPDDPGGGRR
jgi:hypothetical protein